jgi:hypothetical protein
MEREGVRPLLGSQRPRPSESVDPVSRLSRDRASPKPDADRRDARDPADPARRRPSRRPARPVLKHGPRSYTSARARRCLDT